MSKTKPKKSLSETQALLKVVHELRTQCPWDKKQTHKTLSRYMLEEAFEASEAMQGKDRSALKEELGDVLLQVALHSEIASEKGWFDFEDVSTFIKDKMIRRHPHIYAKAEVRDYKTHMKNWSKLKQEEKPKKTLLEGIPRSLPALLLAQRYGEIAGSVGFDWDGVSSVFEKVQEEISELQEAIKKKEKKERVEEEMGDLLFALTQMSRHLKIDAEGALRAGALKFRDRFTSIEKRLAKKGRKITDCTPQELEKLWQAEKKI